jgi:hypothetical protein
MSRCRWARIDGISSRLVGRRKRDANSGMTVIAAKYEPIIAKMTALASARNSTLTTPVKKTIGKKTISVEIVEVSTGIATS